MSNTIAVLMSVAYIFLVLGIATLYARWRKGSSEGSRKLVHILVGNWVFLTPMFTDLWAVVLVPFSFIIINALSRKYTIFSAMERKDDGFGTVYYAVSMFVLSGAAFLLKWPTLSFVGLLTMAYGDGLAAIVGVRWGRRKPFAFSPKKSLAGSVTVAASAFVITAACLMAFQGTGALRPTTPLTAILIALATAVFSALTELSGSGGCDNLSLPIGAGLFATLSLQFATPGLFLYLAISAAILAAELWLKAITADGAVAALLTAITLYALGGVWVGASLLAFFLLGSAASRLNNERKRAAEKLQSGTGTRNWKQVLCNSLPACVLTWLAFTSGDQRLNLAALAVFAGAAADTFSSEFGMLSTGRVFAILGGRPVERGLSGGVTWAGLGAGAMGSMFLSLFALPAFGWAGFVVCALLGFLGTIFDSVLGASLQAKYVSAQGQLQEMPGRAGALPQSGFLVVTNNAVNLISLTMIAALGIFAAWTMLGG